MYSYLTGELIEINQQSVVLECQGIGYEILVPGKIMEELPQTGNLVKIYTYLYVREDAFLLYGFLSKEDKQIFKLLLGVSGIGPKGALSILSVMSTDDFRFAVLSNDAKAIAKAPGVGNKTAQRLLLELKDKLSLDEAFALKTAHSQMNHDQEAAGSRTEAIEALTALGYASSEAARVIRLLPEQENETVEQLLKEALKQLAFL